MIELSKRQAQKYIIHCQYLNQQKLKGKSGALKVIEQLGYVQIDTISVIERAHHHVLWSRVPNYQPNHLFELLEAQQIYDYWAHAASFLPMCDYHFSLYRKQEYKKGKGHWHQRNEKLMQYVLDRFKSEGELMARDFKKDSFEGAGIAWAQHPINQALRQLFMEGTIMISKRKGFQKVYDLPENVLPNSVNQTLPSQRAYYTYLIERDVQAHGLIQMRELGYLLKIDKSFLKQLLEEMIEAGELIAVKIEGIAATYYAKAKALMERLGKRQKAYFHILSPFDNLVIQRRRLSALFDFDYLLECYVPAKKRQFGYFCLPLLYGTEFVGQIDLKADRKTGRLLVKQLTWVPQFEKNDKVRVALFNKLVDFAKFNQCTLAENDFI